jgi:Lon protease-like protein
MNALERVQATLDALKVFPLPGAVLFPGTAVPLHIFEPRYRAMVRDCLQGDRILALAQIEPHDAETRVEKPRLRPICCAGMVIWQEGLPDGRSNIILQGIVRARILGELDTPALPYRQVQIQPLEDPPFDGPEEALLRQAVLELSGRIPAEAGEELAQTAARTSGGGLADAVAAAVISDADRRQALLCELDVAARLRAVLEEVGELMARLNIPNSAEPLN